MDSIPSNTCPIKYWKKQRPKALAIGSYTYEEFDTIIKEVEKQLPKEPIIIFYPQKKVKDIAIFFAAWRREKAVFPLNFRLPEAARAQRVEKVQEEPPLATLIETSSSSKIVAHTYSSHLISAKAAIEALGICESDRYCLNLPLFHVSGIATLLRTFTAGAHLIFEESANLATHISMVPTQLFRMLEENRYLPKLKTLLLGGAPLSTTLKKRAKHLPIFCSYGMTETASMVLIQKENQPVEVLPHTSYKRGEDKELLLRGKTLLHHYVGQKKRDPDEWFATKDLIDDNLQIIGRKDRQFISGGENIQPEEIESSLMNMDGIIEARVTSVEDPEWGRVPVAKVLSSREFYEKDIHDALKERLPSFKIPKKIEVLKASGEWESKSTKLCQ